MLYRGDIHDIREDRLDVRGHDVPKKTLRQFPRRAIDNIITFIQFSQQDRYFLGRMLQVLIHRDDHIVLRMPDTAQRGIMLSIISHQADAL